MKGWVYVISNEAMPGLVKVGFTSKDPEARARQLDNTGSPHPYLVCYEILVEDPRRVERLAHGSLSGKSENKEWFRCSIEEAISAIKHSAGEKIITEIYTRSDRLRAEVLQQVENGLENIERNHKEALEGISRRRGEQDLAAQEQFKKLGKPIVESVSFWLFWCIGGFAVGGILESTIGDRDGDMGTLVISIILGFFLGGFLHTLALDRRKGFEDYRRLIAQRDRKLHDIGGWYDDELRKLEVKHGIEKRKIESTRDSDLKKLTNQSVGRERGERNTKSGMGAIKQRAIDRNQPQLNQVTDREQPVYVTCKNCGQRLKIRRPSDHTPSSGVRWRCPTCDFVWSDSLELTRDSDLKKLANQSVDRERGGNTKSGMGAIKQRAIDRNQPQLKQVTDREHPVYVTCKNCGQRLKIRRPSDHTPSNDVRWRCPTCDLVWSG